MKVLGTHYSQFIQIIRDLSQVRFVICLEVMQLAFITGKHKADCGTLLPKSSSSANPMNIVFFLFWQVVINDHLNVLHIDASSKQVSRDQDLSGMFPEVFQYLYPLNLIHLTVHCLDCDFSFGHRLNEFLDSFIRVTIDNDLSMLDTIQSFVQLEERLKLPLILVYRYKVLADTLKWNVFLLDKGLCRVNHEVFTAFKNIFRESR